jgi:hypothetical protein
MFLSTLSSESSVENVFNGMSCVLDGSSRYTAKKYNDFPVPSRDVTIIKLSLDRNN